MIMKKVLALSVLALTVFASTLGPAIASESAAIRSERGAAGWDGPQDPWVRLLLPANSGRKCLAQLGTER
jgi:hypothetical protein